jgi:hypothetical protein
MRTGLLLAAIFTAHVLTVVGGYFLRISRDYAVTESDVALFVLPSLFALGSYLIILKASVRTTTRLFIALALAFAGLNFALAISVNVWGA